jgi:hypothetical protein
MAKRGHSPHFDECIPKKTYTGKEERSPRRDEATLDSNNTG